MFHHLLPPVHKWLRKSYIKGTIIYSCTTLEESDEYTQLHFKIHIYCYYHYPRVLVPRPTLFNCSVELRVKVWVREQLPSRIGCPFLVIFSLALVAGVCYLSCQMK